MFCVDVHADNSDDTLHSAIIDRLNIGKQVSHINNIKRACVRRGYIFLRK